MMRCEKRWKILEGKWGKNWGWRFSSSWLRKDFPCRLMALRSRYFWITCNKGKNRGPRDCSFGPTITSAIAFSPFHSFSSCSTSYSYFILLFFYVRGFLRRTETSNRNEPSTFSLSTTKACSRYNRTFDSFSIPRFFVHPLILFFIPLFFFLSIPFSCSSRFLSPSISLTVLFSSVLGKIFAALCLFRTRWKYSIVNEFRLIFSIFSLNFWAFFV